MPMLPTQSDVRIPDQKFQLGLLGFTQADRALINSITKLSRARILSRNRGDSQTQTNKDNQDNTQYWFEIVDINDGQSLDIVLFNVDTLDPQQTRQWTKIKRLQPQATLVLVGNALLTAYKNGIYTVARTRNHFVESLLYQLDQVAAECLKQQAEAVVRSKTCLVVDDSQLVRVQMELLLNNWGVAAEFAESAEVGLRLARDKRYDLIFLDVMLPEMDGYQACKLLKTTPATSATPVVMLTSKRSPFNRMHGALVGCDHYLTKPVDADKVMKTLQQYALLEVGAEEVQGAVLVSSTPA
jgi:CheY-like chemotaxis protein